MNAANAIQEPASDSTKAPGKSGGNGGGPKNGGAKSGANNATGDASSNALSNNPQMTDLTREPLDSAMRHPLMVLAVLTPVFLWAEGLRYLAGNEQQLLAEQQLAELGHGMVEWINLAPYVVLFVGCLLVQIISKRSWSWPGSGVMLWVMAWGAIWGGVRWITSYTSFTLLPPEASLANTVSNLDSLTQLAVFSSGALQEELLFRGIILGAFIIIFPVLGMKHPAWKYCLALPVSAIIFALAHTNIISHHAGAVDLQWPLAVTHVLGGLIYGYAFCRHGLAVAVLAHLVANLMRAWI